jgi:platelet-activating factor acetylhydrolase IB subunit alpha
MQLTGHDNWIRSLLFHPDGKYIISVSDDKSIRVWSLQEERCIKVIEDAHTHFIQSLDFCKQNPHYVTGCVDNTLSIWSCR